MQMNVIDCFKSKTLFYLFNSATKPTFMQIFSNICAIVLKASMDWPTPTYELYISVIQKQRYSNLLHYFDHSAKFGRFQSAKHNTMNKNVRKWPRICRKFQFWVEKVHFFAYFSWTTNFSTQDHHKPCKWTWLIISNPKFCFICSIQQQNPHLCKVLLSFLQ